MLRWVVATTALVLAAAGGPQPTAELRFFQNSGWPIATPTYQMVFDYVESLSPADRLPEELRLTADSFDRRRVAVFVSHGHADPLFPDRGAWAAARPDLRIVLGWPDNGLHGASGSGGKG